MPISVNLTGVETKATPLPPGYYRGAVSQCEQKISQSGNAYIAWVFTVVSPEEFMGRKAFYNTSLQPQALWNLKKMLQALGYSEDDLSGEIEFEPTDLLGIEATLVVVEDEYKGETTSRVDQVLPMGSEE